MGSAPRSRTHLGVLCRLTTCLKGQRKGKQGGLGKSVAFRPDLKSDMPSRGPVSTQPRPTLPSPLGTMAKGRFRSPGWSRAPLQKPRRIGPPNTPAYPVCTINTSPNKYWPSLWNRRSHLVRHLQMARPGSSFCSWRGARNSRTGQLARLPSSFFSWRGARDSRTSQLARPPSSFLSWGSAGEVRTNQLARFPSRILSPRSPGDSRTFQLGGKTSNTRGRGRRREAERRPGRERAPRGQRGASLRHGCRGSRNTKITVQTNIARVAAQDTSGEVPALPENQQMRK